MTKNKNGLEIEQNNRQDCLRNFSICQTVSFCNWDCKDNFIRLNSKRKFPAGMNSTA
jgi:hypothetical protein